MAAGADAVWVANSFDDTVTRVDPRRNRIAGPPIRVPDAEAIASGGGSAWVAQGTNGTVTRIDAARNAVRGRAIRVGEGSARAIAYAAGFTWAGANASDIVSGKGAIVRIAPRSGDARRAPVDEPGVLGLASGFGRLWVLTTNSTGRVQAIDPATLRRDGAPARGVDGAQTIAGGAQAIWVGTDDGRIARLVPR